MRVKQIFFFSSLTQIFQEKLHAQNNINESYDVWKQNAAHFQNVHSANNWRKTKNSCENNIIEIQYSNLRQQVKKKPKKKVTNTPHPYSLCVFFLQNVSLSLIYCYTS